MAASSSLYRDHGWSIIPVDADTKKPHVAWKVYATKPPDLQVVEAWGRQYPKAGIAVITGQVSGIVVLDCDGTAGVAEATSKGLPNTPIVTTPNGGLHAYFKAPDFVVRNAAKLGESRRLDIRGEAGYVLAPNSRRNDGRRYSWVISPSDASIADAPEWVVALFNARAEIEPTPLFPYRTECQMDVLGLSERTVKLIKEGNDGSFPSRSECDFYVICELVAAGIPDDWIEKTFAQAAIGEKYREGQGTRYLMHQLDQAKSRMRIVTIKYADLQEYEGGSRLHLALLMGHRMIRTGLTVPDMISPIRKQGVVTRWESLFEAAGVGVGDLKALPGKKMAIQFDPSRRDSLVASFHRAANDNT